MRKIPLYFKIAVVLLTSIVIISIIYSADQHHHKQLSIAAQNKIENDLHLIGQGLEFKFRLLYQGLRTIARMPGLASQTRQHARLSSVQQNAIQEIYNNLAENIRVSEVYVISRDFNPDNGNHRSPYAAFEDAVTSGQAPHTNTHNMEDELLEYQQIHRHLLYFKKNYASRNSMEDMDYPAIISQEVITCDRSQQTHRQDQKSRLGIVQSMPYYDESGQLQGIISGVLLSRTVSNAIKQDGYVLTNHGVNIYSEDLLHKSKAEKTALVQAGVIQLNIKDLSGVWTLIRYSDQAAESEFSILDLEDTVYLLYAAIVLISILSLIYLINQERFRKRLLTSERKNSTILESAFDAIITINHRGVIESFNTSSEKIFGYKAHEVIGRNVSMLMPKAVARQHDAYLERHIASGKVNIVGKRREEIGLRKNGEEFPMQLAVTDTNIDGNLIFTGIISDITEIKRQQQEIDLHRHHLQELVDEKTEEIVIAKETVEEAYRAKSEFLANMSHELRTPMHTILSFAELGIKKHATASGEKILQYFTRIHDGGKRQLELLNDLLDLSKLEAGKVIYHFSTSNITEILGAQIDLHAALAEQKRLTFSVLSEVDNTTAYFDSDKISQVVRNLLSNAIKFSDENSKIVVRIYPYKMKTGCQEKDMLAVEVSDTGIGIPLDEQEHIFDKFVQSSSTKSGAGGTGLGLSICAEIMEGHGGIIWADSDGKKQTRFTFCLPITPD